VFDRDHLSYWERTRGQHLANLRSDSRVAVMYFNRERGKYLRMYGRAELHEEGPVRDEIMARYQREVTLGLVASAVGQDGTLPLVLEVPGAGRD